MKNVPHRELALHRVLISLISCFFISVLSFSQLTISYDSIKEKDHSKGISLTTFKLWSENKQGVFFFCPVGDGYNDSMYIDKSKQFAIDTRMSGFKGHLKFVFYKESFNFSKNPFLINIFKTNDSILNQLQCFVYLNSDKNIKRAEKIIGEKFNYKADKNYSNLYRIDLSDKVCPKDLPSKIVLFIEVLNEILVPKFSLEEKIEQLELKINILELELQKIKNQNSNCNNEILQKD